VSAGKTLPTEARCNPGIERANVIGGSVFLSINRHGVPQAVRFSGIDVARTVKTLATRAGLALGKYAGLRSDPTP